MPSLPARCGATTDGGDGGPCILPPGHDESLHEARDGSCWLVEVPAAPLRRDPREVVGIYLSDSLAGIATARRVLADHGLTDLALDNLLDTARIALESARQLTEEMTDHA